LSESKDSCLHKEIVRMQWRPHPDLQAPRIAVPGGSYDNAKEGCENRGDMLARGV